MADKYANWEELVSDRDPATGELVNQEGRDWYISVRPGEGPYLTHIAIHGGVIEPPPEQLADAASDGGPFYTFAGIKPSGNQDLHITATNWDEPQCVNHVQASQRCVSWHGHADRTPGLAVTYVGGLDTGLGLAIRSRLVEAGFTVQNPPADLAGRDPDNICNKTTIARGVQLELSRSQREAFYVNGDLSLGAIQDPANRTQAFTDYVAAVRAGVTDFQEAEGECRDVPLDPTAPAEIQLGGPVELSQVRVHQQAVFDDTTGDVYVTQVIDGGQTLPGEPGPVSGAERAARGDLAINRVSSDGVLTGVMYVRRFDHGGGIAIDYDYAGPMLWLAYDAEEVPIGANAHGSKVARFPFQDGAVLDVGHPSIEVFDPFPGARAVLPSIDLIHGRIAVNYGMPGQPRRYRVWDLEIFKSRNFEEHLYDVPWSEDEDRFQSFTFYGRYIYQSHGSGYSTANPPPGNALFVIIDVTTGRKIRIAANEQYPGLMHREPEALTILNTMNGPRLVFGFATGPVGDREMNLYATLVNSCPGTWISAEVVPGQGIALNMSVQDRRGLRSWRVVRRPDNATLFEGSAGEFPPGVAQMVDTGPPRCVPLSYVLVLEYEDRTQEVESRSVTWVPPEGCGGARVVAEAPETLSCAEAYSARVHWRGGGLVKPLAIMERLTDVQWSRTINDVSTATVTLSKQSAACCEEIADVHDWVHELTIYRHVRGEAHLVWQGPIQKIRVQRESVVIEAADVFKWLDRLVNTFRVTYTSADPDPRGRRRGTIVYIANNHLRLNVEESSLSVPPDYPQIMDYVVAREDGLPTVRVEKDGSTNTAIWRNYLGNIFREWTKRGLTWTTVGRSLVLRGFPNQQTLPIARFSTNDLLGNIEVIRDGEQTRTYSFATNQDRRDVSDGFTVGWGHVGTPYGRLDLLTDVNDEVESETEAREVLLEAAKTELQGRYPTPLVLQLPATAQVAPEAPITVEKLVPGERFDVFGDDFCIPVARGFALSDVEGTWDGRERISIALVPLDEVREGQEGEGP